MIYVQPEINISTTLNISIYNQLGKLLYSNTINELFAKEALKIDISAFENGIYILKLTNSQSIIIKKLIKD